MTNNFVPFTNNKEELLILLSDSLENSIMFSCFVASDSKFCLIDTIFTSLMNQTLSKKDFFHAKSENFNFRKTRGKILKIKHGRFMYL